jgi:uncharacterized protein
MYRQNVYTLDVVFEWDTRKADANAAKHGVRFTEAETVFLDPHRLDAPDLSHSRTELRRRTIGRSVHDRVVFVVYTSRSTAYGEVQTTRLISARQASRAEREVYHRSASTDPG